MSNFGLEPWSVGLGSPLSPAILAPPLQPSQTGGAPREMGPLIFFPAFSLLHQNLLEANVHLGRSFAIPRVFAKGLRGDVCIVYLLFGAWGQGRNVHTHDPQKAGRGVTMGIGPADLRHLAFQVRNSSSQHFLGALYL